MIGARRPTVTPHLRPARAKARTAAAPATPDVRDLRQTIETTEWAATLPIRVGHLQTRGTKKSYWGYRVGNGDVKSTPRVVDHEIRQSTP